MSSKSDHNIYASTSFVGYSLWLVPDDGETIKKLQDVIDHEAKVHTTPLFSPHVTLLGGIAMSENEVVKKTNEIAQQLKAYEMHIEDIATKDLFFQCLFGLINSSFDVLNANKIAQKIFYPGKDSNYMPHLSLVYGNLSEQQKKEMKSRVYKQVVGTRFRVNSIEVWCTTGEVSEWILVKKIPFSKKD